MLFVRREREIGGRDILTYFDGNGVESVHEALYRVMKTVCKLTSAWAIGSYGKREVNREVRLSTLHRPRN